MSRLSAILTVMCLLLAVTSSYADETVAITQVDMTNYPEIITYVTVVDENGRHMTDLKKADFEVKEDGTTVEIVDFAGTGEARAADIVFVFDTTTSMAEEVDDMKRISLDFAEQLEQSHIDFRLGLVDFGDIINRIEPSNGGLTNNAESFKNWIEEVRLEGGGYDIPELSLGALQMATEMVFRDDVMKIFILITDAPPHHYGDSPDANVVFNDPDLTLANTIKMLETTNSTVYVVAPPHEDFRSIADTTGGKYFDIHGASDFTAIIEEIGGIIAEQYRLVYLSPRPTYDGTRRDIVITVGGAVGSSDYLEPHLLNIRSSWLVGLLLLIPLLLALALPTAIGGKTINQESHIDEITADNAQPRTNREYCKNCGNALRADAKFCNRCGQQVVTLPQPPPITSNMPELTGQPGLFSDHPSLCTRCGRPLRKNAKFCGKCGQIV